MHRLQRRTTTPELDRLERMLNTSDRIDQEKHRGTQYARDHGPKRLYAKAAPDRGQAQAQAAQGTRLYARWQQAENPRTTKHTPERAARDAALCCQFLQRVGQELRQARGAQAQEVLGQLDELIALSATAAPTTDVLRWTARRLRDCHQGVKTPPPQVVMVTLAAQDSDDEAPSNSPSQGASPRGTRPRFLSLGSQPRQAQRDSTRSPASPRTHRDSWQAPGSRK